MNGSKILTKHILWKCECKFDGRKCSSNQKWNNDKCRCKGKGPEEHNSYEKGYILSPATCICENGK